MSINETAHDYLVAFFNILFKRKKLIFGFMLGVFALVCVYLFTATPIYEANAQVLVKLGRENIYVPQVGNYAPILNENSVEQINSEVELLKSQALAEKVLKLIGAETLYPALKERGMLGRLKDSFFGGGDKSPEERGLIRFQKSISVQGIRNSRVIEISFRHSDPLLAARVVNHYVATYMDERLRVHQDPQSFAFFDEQTRLLRDKIQKSEETLRRLKSMNEVVELGQERDLLLRRKSELEVGANDTMIRIQEMQRRIAQLKQHLEAVPALVPQGEETESNPLLINTLQAQLVQLELRKRELLNKYTESNRFVREVEEQIRGVQTRLSEEESRRYGRARFGPNPSFQQIKDDFLRSEVELKTLNAKLAVQKEQLEQLRQRLDQLASSEIALNQLQNELEVDRRNYQLYLTKAEENRITHEMDTRKIANVSVIRNALPPLEPVLPQKGLTLGLGVLFALVGGLGIALGLEMFRDHFENPDEVESALGVPVLASIPYQKG